MGRFFTSWFYFSNMNKRKSLIVCVVMLFFLSCRGNIEQRYISEVVLNDKTEIEFKGLNIKINKIIYCAYPKNDPVYGYHKNTKLILFEIELKYTELGVDKKGMIPDGNLLVGLQGDAYRSSPGVIAMAQNSKCIQGDDIAGYNQIWNGIIDKTARAFALGFEVPANFVPDKLYWNNECRANNMFFILGKTKR